jgi:hypothetical protein
MSDRLGCDYGPLDLSTIAVKNQVASPNCNASGNSPINRIERPNPRPYGRPRSEIPWLATEVVRKDEEAFTWRVPQIGGRSMKSQPTLPSGTTESAPRLLRSACKGVKP